MADNPTKSVPFPRLIIATGYYSLPSPVLMRVEAGGPRPWKDW